MRQTLIGSGPCSRCDCRRAAEFKSIVRGHLVWTRKVRNDKKYEWKPATLEAAGHSQGQ